MTNEGWTIIGTVAGVLGLLLTCFGLIDAKRKRRHNDENACEYILDDSSYFEITSVTPTPSGDITVTITYLGDNPAHNVSVRFANISGLIRKCSKGVVEEFEAKIDVDDVYNKSHDFDKNESIDIVVDKKHLDSVLGPQISFEWSDEEGRKHRVVKDVRMDINDNYNTKMKKERAAGF